MSVSEREREKQLLVVCNLALHTPIEVHQALESVDGKQSTGSRDMMSGICFALFTM